MGSVPRIDLKRPTRLFVLELTQLPRQFQVWKDPPRLACPFVIILVQAKLCLIFTKWRVIHSTISILLVVMLVHLRVDYSQFLQHFRHQKMLQWMEHSLKVMPTASAIQVASSYLCHLGSFLPYIILSTLEDCSNLFLNLENCLYERMLEQFCWSLHL